MRGFSGFPIGRCDDCALNHRAYKPMQTRSKREPRILRACAVGRFVQCCIFSLFLIGCTSSARVGNLQYVGTFTNQELLQKMFMQYRVPLIVIGHDVFLLPTECQCEEQRTYGAEVEQRRRGGEGEQRRKEGADEERRIAGQSEQRQMAGGTEERKTGGATEERSMGQEGETRRLEGLGEKRELSGGIEQRAQGGAVEKRTLGGGHFTVRCVRLSDCEGFEILEGARLEMQWYDGKVLRPVLNGVVLYH